MRWLLLATLLTACGPDLAQREVCYAQAKQHAKQRALSECAGIGFDSCPSSDDIMDDYQAEQERCK